MQLPLGLPEEETRLRPEVAALPTRAERLARLLQGDLDFHGRQDASPLHALHPFPAKYPPQLPRLFIQHLTQPGEVVLDPMMGSGTTVLEARRLGRRAVGTDIDPLALHLVAAKVAPPSPLAFEEGFARVLRRAEAHLGAAGRLAEEYARRFDDATQRFLDYWFLPDTQRELLALSMAIAQEAPALRLFLQIVFSSLIIAKSGSVAQARDLSHTRPHRVRKPVKPALEVFRVKARRALRMLTEHAGFPPTAPPALLAEADAQHLPLPTDSVALIVTSPPYAANAIDYMRAHKFTLVWWGYSVRQLSALRREYIGGEALQGVCLEPLPGPAERAVEQIAAVDPKKGRVLHRYFSEMRRVLWAMRRVLVPGGAAVLVVGESTMRGQPAQVPQSLGAIGEQVGLALVSIGERRLDRDRRMMPARRGRAATAIEQRMHVEYVLGFVKPGGKP